MSWGVGPRCGSDMALLWLWHRQASTAQIRPLAWEPTYAVGAALENAKRQKENAFYIGGQSDKSFRNHLDAVERTILHSPNLDFVNSDFTFFFFFNFICHTKGIWKFLGQELNPSHISSQCHSCSYARSFNPLHRARAEPTPPLLWLLQSDS